MYILSQHCLPLVILISSFPIREKEKGNANLNTTNNRITCICKLIN